MPTVSRSELLLVLESMQPGLTARDVIEQSACFAFKDGTVHTFNDEIACRRKSPIGIEGAVQAASFLEVLRKCPEDALTIDVTEGNLIIKGKGRRFRVRMQAEIHLPFDKIEQPKKNNWNPLHEDFSDAIYVAEKCVGKDESQYANTCVHIHPKHVEAFDNFQALRYKLKTKVREPILVRGGSIKHVVSLDMTEFNETDSWIHFRNTSGLRMSIRRDVQEFQELDSILEVEEGFHLIIPKGLADAAGRCEIFSKENADENELLVELRPGKMRVKGEGISGDGWEVKKTKYKGKSLSFRVSPGLLVELTKRYNDCIVTHDKLKVDTGKFQYCVALGPPEGASDA